MVTSIESVIKNVVKTVNTYGVAEEPTTYEWRKMREEWRNEGHDWPFVVVRGVAYEYDSNEGCWNAAFDPATIEETGRGWQPAEWWHNGNGHPVLFEVCVFDGVEVHGTGAFVTDCSR